MSYVIAASRPVYAPMVKRLSRRLKKPFTLITRPEDLTPTKLKRLAPRMIFFPHWSYYIPREIFERYACVTFHMTDLPFGRGGSPLQNLIVRGFKKTKISAIRTVADMDAGPIYLKRGLSLNGTAEEILVRAARIIEGMIALLIRRPLTPQPQKGRIVRFTRRRSEDGEIDKAKSLQQVYDYIRMLDGAGYPHAFARVGAWRLEFEQVTFKKKRVSAYVQITQQKN